MPLTLLYRHPLVICAFILTCVVVFVFAPWRFGYVDTVLWGCAALLFALFTFPPRHRKEALRSAQKRVLLSLATDRFFWLCAGFAVFAALQGFNSGRELAYDGVLRRWYYGAPVWGRAFPSSVDAACAWNGFAAVAAAATLMVVMRNGVGASGCRLLMGLTGLLGGLAAVWETGVFVWLHGNTDGFRLFANATQGSYWFFAALVLSTALYGYALAHTPRIGLVLLLLACCLLNLAGLAAMQTIWLLLVGWGWFLVAGVAMLWCAWRTLGLATRSFAATVLLLVLVGGVVLFFGGDSDVPGFSHDVCRGQLNLTGGPEKTSAAWRIGLAYLPYGAGIGSYRYLSQLYLPESAKVESAMDYVFADNDFMQMFAETGVFGLAAVAGMAGLFAVGAWKKLKTAPLRSSGSFWVLVFGLGVFLGIACIGSPFQAPPVVLVAAIALAGAPSLLVPPPLGEEF